MKNLILASFIFFTAICAWAKTDYFSAEGFNSNKAYIEEIKSMENALAFIGASYPTPYPYAHYSILFKDENGYRLTCFKSKELDDNRDFKNFSISKKRMPEEGEDPDVDFPLDEPNANILLKTLEEQIALAKEKGFNEGEDAKSLNAHEVGLKLGDKWIFAGKKIDEESIEKHGLDRFSIARKLTQLSYSPSQDFLERRIKALVYDYRILAKESLKQSIINFELERGRQYFALVNFDKDETKATSLVSTKDKNAHFKIMTLKSNFSLKLFPQADPQTDDIKISASMNRYAIKNNFMGAGCSSKLELSKDYEYLSESNYLGRRVKNTEFFSLVRLKAEESWAKPSVDMKKSEDICFAPARLSRGGLFSFVFGSTEKQKIIKHINAKINPPLARFKGQTNKEFCEAFGVATFKGEEMIDFWSIHINSGHTSALSFEDTASDEKGVYDISLDFDQEKRKYSSLIFSLKDKAGTVSYINFVDGEKVDTLRDGFRAKTLNDDIEIIRAYKDESKGLIRVIFSGKIIP